MRTSWLLAAVFGLAACGGPPPPAGSPSPSPAPASTELAPWIVGDWRHAAGQEHWVNVGGVTWGIALGDTSWEVMVIEEVDGVPALVAMPGGAAPTTFPMGTHGDQTIQFVHPGDHDPKAITYRRDGAALVAAVRTLRDAETLTLTMAPTTAAPAPEAEAADRAFDADTAADGLDGWLRHFAADAAMVLDGQRVEGHDGIAAAMGPLFARAQLRWEPTWSRLGPSGTLAATIGRGRIIENGEVVWRSVYATIWRRDADGWKVVFDVGREDRTAP